MFVDPSKGDFRVQANSSALSIGFVNFPMDQFGVQQSHLKAIAKSPEIPTLAMNLTDANGVSKKEKYYWFGASINAPLGDELSAYGTNYADGGVALTDVPENSAASVLGFRTGDLIQQINQVKIKNVNDLTEFVRTNKTGTKFALQIIRNQVYSKMVINRMTDVSQ